MRLLNRVLYESVLGVAWTEGGSGGVHTGSMRGRWTGKMKELEGGGAC